MYCLTVKQEGTLHSPVIAHQLNHGKYHLDYSAMYFDSLSAMFIQNWISFNATGEI